MPLAAAEAVARADEEPRTRGGVVFREEEWVVAAARACFDRRDKELERSSLGRGGEGLVARDSSQSCTSAKKWCEHALGSAPSRGEKLSMSIFMWLRTLLTMSFSCVFHAWSPKS
jgi:hypothetical protein